MNVFIRQLTGIRFIAAAWVLSLLVHPFGRNMYAVRRSQRAADRCAFSLERF